MILLLILVHLFWGIGACILAPGGPRKAQWGHQRAFGAGSKMDSFSSLIEISSELRENLVWDTLYTAIPEICPWEPAQSAVECAHIDNCRMLMHCDIALILLALFAYELRQWEPAQSAVECRRRARCAHTLITAACLCIATSL